MRLGCKFKCLSIKPSTASGEVLLTLDIQKNSLNLQVLYLTESELERFLQKNKLVLAITNKRHHGLATISRFNCRFHRALKF
jgi:hypothetical protein